MYSQFYEDIFLILKNHLENNFFIMYTLISLKKYAKNTFVISAVVYELP